MAPFFVSRRTVHAFTFVLTFLQRPPLQNGSFFGVPADSPCIHFCLNFSTTPSSPQRLLFFVSRRTVRAFTFVLTSLQPPPLHNGSFFCVPADSPCIHFWLNFSTTPSSPQRLLFCVSRRTVRAFTFVLTYLQWPPLHNGSFFCVPADSPCIHFCLNFSTTATSP